MALQLVPTELTEHILTFCHARDVGRIAQTCKQFHALIYDGPDQYLWRELFLLFPFDDLRKAISPPETVGGGVDWRGELQRRVLAETIVSSQPETADPAELEAALQTLLSVVYTALPYYALSPGQVTHSPSDNLTWLHRILQHSPVIRSEYLSKSAARICCELRSQLSLSLQADEGTADSNPHLQDLRSESRCVIYNLTNYSPKNLWGPYLPLTSSPPSALQQLEVNWSHVEHIMNVVVLNMRELEGTPYSLMRPQLGLESTRAYSAPGTADLVKTGSRDWAGLEGLWRRFVCFMDYRCVTRSSLHGPCD